MKRKIYLFFSIVPVLLFFTACIKDTDFNQTDDIVISPVFELDFLFFNVSSENFSANGINNLIVTDTTDFNFLNDQFIIDNLEKAEFFFKNTNSFPIEFNTQFQFLDENNELHYEVTIPINSGTINNPVITETANSPGSSSSLHVNRLILRLACDVTHSNLPLFTCQS